MAGFRDCLSGGKIIDELATVPALNAGSPVGLGRSRRQFGKPAAAPEVTIARTNFGERIVVKVIAHRAQRTLPIRSLGT